MPRTLALLGLGLTLVGAEVNGCHCSVGGLDMNKVEGAIRDTLVGAGFEVSGVECPERAPLEEGHEFECTAEIAGVKVPMVVTQTDGQGTVSYQPRYMVVEVEEYEKEIAAQPGFDAATEVDCHGRIWLSKPGETYSCDVVAHDEPFTVTVTFTNDRGLHDIEAVPKKSP